MRLPNLRPRTLGFIAAALWLSAMTLNLLSIYGLGNNVLAISACLVSMPFAAWMTWQVLAWLLLLPIRFFFWCLRRREHSKRKLLRAIQALRVQGLSAPRKNHVEAPRPWSQN